SSRFQKPQTTCSATAARTHGAGISMSTSEAEPERIRPRDREDQQQRDGDARLSFGWTGCPGEPQSAVVERLESGAVGGRQTLSSQINFRHCGQAYAMRKSPTN